ncbi:MAG: hypothetical protein NTY98_20365 [Verrucomicrobia bacterium]|nr:hypothetical protein [Verrucomicrobiota bacterium]
MNLAPQFRAGAAAILTPLDRLRWLLLKLLGPLAKPLVRRRELRVMAAGCAVVCFSLAATLLSPFWLLALGPVILGVPHLVADVRYLVLRPGLHRRLVLWLPVGIPLLLAGTSRFSMAGGLTACAAMALLARGAWSRKMIALISIAALMAVVWVMGDVAALVFAHAHNFIAVMLWWCWRPRSGQKQQAVVPLLFLTASILLVMGWLEPWARGFAWQPAGLGPSYHLSFLAPGIAEPWALRLVLLFAFAQSVHYGVWLRLIPEDDRPQETPRTFRASARALVADVGTPLMAIVILLSLGIALWAAFDLTAARENYLRMALFHGYLELIAATWLFVERPARLEAAA